MINLVSGDKGTRIKATLTESDNPKDLTGSTILLKFKKRGASSVLLELTGSGTAEELTGGICYFTFTDLDLDIQAGHYEGEIEVTDQSLNVDTVYEKLTFVVRNDF